MDSPSTFTCLYPFISFPISFSLLYLSPYIYYNLPKVQTKMGEGAGWMSPAYRRRLIGNTENPDLGTSSFFLSFFLSLLFSSYSYQIATEPQGVIASIIEFQEKMYLNNKGIITPHVWMSEWWRYPYSFFLSFPTLLLSFFLLRFHPPPPPLNSWPFDLKGVAYVTFNDRAVYFHGNPIIWYASHPFLSILFLPPCL